ncbi:hypothetical protein [Nitrosopumilus sp. S4]
MKVILSVVLSIMLISIGFSVNNEVYADSVKNQKIEIIEDLKGLKENSEISKKSKKSIESAIDNIEKSLEDKFWKNDSELNLKKGGKVLNEDQNAINKLDKILEDKKEKKSIKDQVLQINLKIAEIDKIIVDNAILSAQDIIMSDKGIKKIEKAIMSFEEGSEFLENNDYEKAVNKFQKSLDLIKKSLKDPHVKKMKMIEFEGSGDFNFDGIPDVHLKLIDLGKSKDDKKVHVKISSECVNGEIHDDAKMKIGFSTPVSLSTEFFDNEFKVTNEWFKENDPDKKINPAVITTVSEYFSFPTSGDDLIQKNPENESGSFEFFSEDIIEIGNQPGWVGEFTFKGKPGDYFLHFWMPLTEPTNQGDSCNFISSFSIPTTINP